MNKIHSIKNLTIITPFKDENNIKLDKTISCLHNQNLNILIKHLILYDHSCKNISEIKKKYPSQKNYFLRFISLNKKGNKAIAIGLGYGYTRLVNNLDVEDDSYFSIELDSALRNRISFHSIQVPLELRLRTSTLENFAFWRFYLGYRLNYNFSAKYKPFFGRKTSLENYVTEFTHCLSLSIGFILLNISSLRF